MNISVLNTLTDNAVSHLATRLQIEPVDGTDVGLVRSGKLQADPTVNVENLLVREGGDEWPHIVNGDNGRFNLNVPTYEIGGGPMGGVFWWRRFVVEIKLFFIGEQNRDTARNKSNVILSRLENAVYTIPLPTESDDFGEMASLIQVRGSYINEQGGPGAFIWRGELKFEVLTEKNPYNENNDGVLS